MHFRKKPLQYRVEFACSEGVMQTLEGPVHYVTGDALMTGIAGERWPIPRDRFVATYVPVPPVRMGEDGKYEKHSITVSARQVQTQERIPLAGGKNELLARPGDWVVTDEHGNRWVVANGIFNETYECLEN